MSSLENIAQEHTELVDRSRRSVGRPSRISRNAIIQATHEIGVYSATMSAVAEKLGTSVSALYRHVRNLEELRSLALTSWLRDKWAPLDTGQHWAQLLRDWSNRLFDTFANDPELIAAYAAGRFPLDIEVEGVEFFLNAMCDRGFSEHEAFVILHEMRAVALGAAIVSTAMKSTRLRDQNAVEGAIARRGAERLQHVSIIRQDFQLGIEPSHWLNVVERLIATIAASHGEEPPSSQLGLPSSQ